MFGLKAEVIGGVVLALLILLGVAGLSIRYLAARNANLELRGAQLASAVEGHKRTEATLRRDAAAKEAANVENLRRKNALAAELRETQSKWAELKRTSAEFRDWADVPLPADVRARRLRITAGVQPGNHHTDARPRAAAGDATP